MKNLLLSLPFLLLSVSMHAQKLTGENVLDMMYQKYHGKWHRNLTFVQKTEQIAYEQIDNTQTWYEAIQFPGDLRIDIGDTKNGNLIIFHNDSLFKYQNDSNIYARVDHNTLVFLTGGMYFHTLDSTLTLFKNYKYDMSKAMEAQWKGKDMYVIGADIANAPANQLWIDKETLLVHRIIEYDGWSKMEFQFEDHEQFGESWVETKVTIYQDDKKAQIEYYQDLKVNQPIDSRIFDPYRKQEAKHWYQQGNNK
jgi:hypothetical protein